MKKEQKVTLWKAFRKINSYIMECCSAYYMSFNLVGALHGFLFGISIIVTQFVFDQVAELAQGQGMIWGAVRAILVFAFILTLKEIINGVHNFQAGMLENRVSGFIKKVITEKATKLNPILFEDSKVLDEINKAAKAAEVAPMMVMDVITMFTFYLAYVLVTASYLYSLSPILLWSIPLAFVPKLISTLTKATLYSKLEEKSAPIRREYEFYEQAMTDRQFFKETRLLGVFKHFNKKYLSTIKLLNRETWRTDARSATIDLIMSVLTVAGYLGILYLLFANLQAGIISIGAFAAVFGGVTNLIDIMEEIISNSNDVSESMGKVSFLIRFFDLPEKGGEEKEVNWSGDIEFDKVSFEYPNAPKKSLNDLTLTIKAGETIAIVGENGSGKTTLSKVLMGIYEPTSGSVIVDGEDVSKIVLASRFKGISAVFQDFQKYQLTLKENVELADMYATDSIDLVMKEAGVLLEDETYPEGIETMLSREFDGIDLSGGQWQRVAIARGLYRPHDLIILDEPTAAIDPIEENRLYEKFMQIVADKTAVIITHRLASTRLADRIIVMDNGKIVEDGTHQSLLYQNGLYAKMFKAQEKWYVAE